MQEQDVIPLPSISSLAFVFNTNEISNFKVRFGFGMSSIYCTRNILMALSHQSVSHIIFDCITRISKELQRVLSNRRENQEVFSLFTLQISCLTWKYLVESLQVTEHEKKKVVTFSTMCNKDLSTVRVKCKRTCLIL
jgi:hypothetical protein